MKRGSKRIRTVALAAAAILVGVALAVGGTVLVRGRATRRGSSAVLNGRVAAITDKSLFGLPGLKGALVTAEPGGYVTKTRRGGGFSLRLPPGVYRVSFTAEGRVPVTYERVQVTSAVPASLWPVMFPEPAGEPVAKLMRSEMSPGSGPVAYNTGIMLDATASRNVAPDGIRWEVRDSSGNILNDPYASPATPLQLKPSPIPGSSPLVFTFIPPAPGAYQVRMFLRNAFTGEREVSAEWLVEAENRSPAPYPQVIAGPNPPGRNPDRRLKEGSGLRRVVAGEKVFLSAWAFDKNYPSPELYNPEGRKPDAYGKNFAPPPSRFTWKWRLYEMHGKVKRTDVTELLRASEPGPPDLSPYPWFVAEKPGRYLAALWAEDHDPFGSRLGSPVTLEIEVLPKETALADETSCGRRGCHRGVQQVAAGAGKMSCQTCHGPAQRHLEAGTPQAAEAGGPAGSEGAKTAKRLSKDELREAKAATIQVSYEAAQCGRCHRQFGEWEKSRHADGYPFGYQEIAQPLLLNCAKCHYPQGFADAAATSRKKRIGFGEVEFKKALFPGGPKMFDFSKLPEKAGQGVSCQACHDPHRMTEKDRLGLRLPKDKLCGSCHEEKWQNVLLEGTAGQVGSAYEYPGGQYARENPHDTPDKCVLCHMDTSAEETDAGGVRRLGGHTMRLRDAGPDGRLGGFGPSPDDPDRERQPYGADDLLNLAPCRRCHPEADSFDLKGRQAEIYRLWSELGRELAKRNGGVLPGYKPGDKCATCHRGGTLPFDDDPQGILENAYTNYKLVKNDRSWGIHNYRYTRQLLLDSLESLRPAAGA